MSQGGQLCLGKQHSETPDQRVFTYFSGYWVPEIFDTKKYQNKRNEQHTEEQSADLVSGAGLLLPLGCFCLINDKTAIARGWMMIQGEMSTQAYQRFIMLTSCMVAKQATNLRPESDNPPGSPEPSLPWSPPCARVQSRSEVELQRSYRGSGLHVRRGRLGHGRPDDGSRQLSPQPARPRVLPQPFPRFWR